MQTNNFRSYLNALKVLTVVFTSLILIAATTNTTRNVLIVGDSISMGYTPFLKDSLERQGIYVEHNRGNGGSTLRGRDSIESWIGNRQWDVIVFNFGLHDMVHKDAQNKYDVNGKVSITPEEYRRNLKLIVAKLRETTANLIFVTTTTVPENASGRKVEDPAVYNKIALEVMKENSVAVLDLYTASLKIHPNNSQPANVHYTSEGYRLLAEPILKEIRKNLN